jgi:hypothetical protein
MKSKIYKIMGVALVAMLLASLTVGMAIPASASPDVLEWSPMPFPRVGVDGNWFRSEDIESVGPIARAIDGSLFAAAWVNANHDLTIDLGEECLFKSTDEGRTWKKTRYQSNDGAIIAIVPSSENADIVYVATANEVWKSDNVFAPPGWKFLEGCVPPTGITCMDVGYKGGNPYIFVGAQSISYPGDYDVWYLDETGYGAAWKELCLSCTYDGTPPVPSPALVVAVACDPNFDETNQVIAVVTDGFETWVTNNKGSEGVWKDEVELGPAGENRGGIFPAPGATLGNGTGIAAIRASRICFPSDFDSKTNYEFFVGVDTGTTGGEDVYRVLNSISYDCDVRGPGSETDIISLDLVGATGSTYLMAGASLGLGPTLDASTFTSTDDAGSWKGAKKAASGTGPAYVVVASDFDESGKAWVATTSTATEGSAVSYTANSGANWNQISLIDTANAKNIVDITFGGSDRYMVTIPVPAGGWVPTNNDVWKFDGTYWERVLCDDNIQGVEKVQTSPANDAVFIADPATPLIQRSTDGGLGFAPLACVPGAFTSWLVVDKSTVLAGITGGGIFKTKNNGRTPWGPCEGTPAADVVSFAMSGERIIAGDNGGGVSESTDTGDNWAALPPAMFDATNVYVALGPDGSVYAAGAVGGKLVAKRFSPPKWVTILSSTTYGSTATAGATGIVCVAGCSPSGTLYVSDFLAGGVFRSLNPGAPEEPPCEFEQVTKGGPPALYDLNLTSGSNVLWGIDAPSLTGDVWTYEDTLAVKVALTSPKNGSSSGRESSVTLQWTALDGPTAKYELQLGICKDLLGCSLYSYSAYCVGPTGSYVVNIPKEFQGQTLYWRVRVAAGEPILSCWSDTWSFSTQLSEAQWNPFTQGNFAPASGATDVILRPGFQWNPADWATGYEFELATNPATGAGGYYTTPLKSFIKGSALTGVTWACDSDLTYSTTYYWHVRAISASSQSEWANGVFTTMAQPPAPTPPVTVSIPPQPAPITPAWIWAIVIIGAILVIAVIVLIVTTRRVP